MSYISKAKYEGGASNSALKNIDTDTVRFVIKSKDDCTVFEMDASECEAHLIVAQINKSIYGASESENTQSLYVAVPGCTSKDMHGLKIYLN